MLDDRGFETCGATVSQISCQQFDLLVDLVDLVDWVDLVDLIDLVDLVDLLDVVDWVDKRSVGREFSKFIVF